MSKPISERKRTGSYSEFNRFRSIDIPQDNIVIPQKQLGKPDKSEFITQMSEIQVSQPSEFAVKSSDVLSDIDFELLKKSKGKATTTNKFYSLQRIKEIGKYFGITSTNKSKLIDQIIAIKERK